MIGSIFVFVGVCFLVSGAAAIFSFFLAGPMLMDNYNKRSLKDSFLNFGNFLYLNTELKDLQIEIGDSAIGAVRAIYIYGSIISIVCFLLVLIIAIIKG